jgi:chromosome segregation ATPase
VTITLGWKSAVAAAVLAIALGLGIFFAVRGARQRSVKDWERQQLIEGLRDRLDKAQVEIDRLGKDADSYRKQRDDISGELADARTKYQQLLARPKPTTPEQESELCEACNEYVVLLETGLRLADMETLTLRKELSVMAIALSDTQDMYELQTARLKASQRDKKKVRRRNIWTIVSASAATMTLGWGIGRL